MKRIVFLQWFLLLFFFLVLGVFLSSGETPPTEVFLIFPILILLLQFAKKRTKLDMKSAKIVSCNVLYVPVFGNPLLGFPLIVEQDGQRKKTRRLSPGDSFWLLSRSPEIRKNILKNSFRWIWKMHKIKKLSLSFYFFPEENTLLFQRKINPFLLKKS